MIETDIRTKMKDYLIIIPLVIWGSVALFVVGLGVEVSRGDAIEYRDWASKNNQTTCVASGGEVIFTPESWWDHASYMCRAGDGTVSKISGITMEDAMQSGAVE